MSFARFEPSFRLALLCSVAALSAGIAGCATTSSTQKLHTASGIPEQRFTMTGNGFQTTALITKGGAQGPSVDIGRYEDGKAIRGTVNGRPLNITVSGTHADGQWGSGPLNVDVDEQEKQLKMTGLVAGRPSTWTATLEAIQGNIGHCSYDMRRSGQDYVGSRSCAGGISPVTVEFPSTILEWQPINIAVLMALLMSTP